LTLTRNYIIQNFGNSYMNINNQDHLNALVIDRIGELDENVIPFLQSANWIVTSNRDESEIVNLINQKHFNLIIINLDELKMKFEIIMTEVISNYPETSVIIISERDNLDNAIDALNIGAWDIVLKPIENLTHLGHSIIKTIERSRLYQENVKYRNHLEKEIEKRTEELKIELDARKKAEKMLMRSLDKINKVTDGMIKTISYIGTIKDPYTGGHQKRVAHLARSIAEELDIDDEKIKGIYVAGMLHDIGKISIPTEILSKPGKISDVEFLLIKTHPTVSYEILKEIEFPWPVATATFQHHEKLDGSGYPKGISNNDILLESRIITVADIVESVTSHRPYRASLGIDKALDIIESEKGICLDTNVVNVCAKLFRDKGYSIPEFM
ncbi:MAG: HD domain-containing protein, partial [Spirochaetota bacterium]|nr:HD domain-containing protein [Spirochaetota bacterium]